MTFCSEYARNTGARVVATVITPAAQQLADEIWHGGKTDAEYAEKITEVAKVADIGLHGHFFQGDSLESRYVHNYWNDMEIV